MAILNLSIFSCKGYCGAGAGAGDGAGAGAGAGVGVGVGVEAGAGVSAVQPIKRLITVNNPTRK